MINIIGNIIMFFSLCYLIYAINVVTVNYQNTINKLSNVNKELIEEIKILTKRLKEIEYKNESPKQ